MKVFFQEKVFKKNIISERNGRASCTKVHWRFYVLKRGKQEKIGLKLETLFLDISQAFFFKHFLNLALRKINSVVKDVGFWVLMVFWEIASSKKCLECCFIEMILWEEVLKILN